MDVRRSVLRTSLVLLFVLSILQRPANATEPFILISDIDDTVKITNVLDRDDAVKNAVAGEQVFAGMAELYKYMLGPDSTSNRLIFMSGSPKVLAHKVRELLNDSGFPTHRTVLRDRRETFRSASEYKTKHIQRMYATSQAQFMLIGDDTESDPEVYAAFAVSKRPDQVLAIYIHRVTGRQLPSGTISFVTAYDIAVHEYQAGRLSEDQAASVGAVVLASRDRNFLPRFQECPNESVGDSPLPNSLADLKLRINNRLAELCERRKAAIPP